MTLPCVRTCEPRYIHRAITKRGALAILSALGALNVLVPPLVAADSALPAPQARLPLVEVIARRLPGQTDDLQYVEREQLESTTRQNVARALDQLPGVYITPLGARSESLVNVRGFDSRQVPLYVDGIPVYVPYDGNIDLSRLGVWDVEAIRVTRAGGSVLYGPNALGGAINVVTRRPAEGLDVAARAGLTLDDSLDQQRYDLGLLASAAGRHWYVQGTFSLADKDFFRLPGDFSSPPPIPPRTVTTEYGGRRGNSATRDVTGGLKIGWRGDSGADWQLAWARLDGEKQTPPYAGISPPPPNRVQPRFWRWPYYDKESIYLIGAVPVSESLWVRTRFFYDTFENSLVSYNDENYNSQTAGYAFTSNYDDYSWGGTAELEWSPAADESITRATLYYKRDVHRETDDVDEPEERLEDATWAVAAEHQRALSPSVRVVLGLGLAGIDTRRADNNLGGGLIEPFSPLTDDSAVNAQAGLTWAATDVWSLGANIARKTRFPTIKDRYSYRLGRAKPNADLEAETADHLEFSASGTLLGATTRLALFGSEVDDAIEAVTLPDIDPGTDLPNCTTPPCTQNQNVGRQQNLGVELSLARTVPVIGGMSLDYTWLDRDNESSPGLKPAYTPRQKFSLGSRTPLGERVVLSVDFKAESGRYSQTNGVRRTGGFGLLDAGVEVGLIPGLRLLIEAANLTDRLYAYDQGFPESGRTYSATVLWQPGKE